MKKIFVTSKALSLSKAIYQVKQIEQKKLPRKTARDFLRDSRKS